MSTRKRRKVTDQNDVDRIVFLHGLGSKISEISKELNYSIPAIEEAIETSKTDDQAGLRLAAITALASKMSLKVDMLLDAITPETIQTALQAGKIKDVAQSVAILTEKRAALLEDAKVRAGAQLLQGASDVDRLVSRLAEGISKVQLRQTRIKALKARAMEIPHEDS